MIGQELRKYMNERWVEFHVRWMTNGRCDLKVILNKKVSQSSERVARGTQHRMLDVSDVHVHDVSDVHVHSAILVCHVVRTSCQPETLDFSVHHQPDWTSSRGSVFPVNEITVCPTRCGCFLL